SPPSLGPPQSSPEAHRMDTAHAPVETVSIVPGTPTEAYSLVARGVHRCWLGPDGPLKPTHVFHAEAEPPAKGGAAEIVLKERCESRGERGGAQAFGIEFKSARAGGGVGRASLKREPQLGQLMPRDAAAWARGGTECEGRKQFPPQASAPRSTQVVGKGD